MQKGLSVLKDIFNIDLRSLALFRILVGVCLFVDIVYRIPFAYDFYSDQGVLPREALVTKFMNVWEISVFLISGQTFTVTVLLVVAAISALCLANSPKPATPSSQKFFRNTPNSYDSACGG